MLGLLHLLILVTAKAQMKAKILVWVPIRCLLERVANKLIHIAQYFRREL